MAECTECKCKKQPCGCEDQGLTTPCPPVIPCDDPNACPETFDAKCVYYTGVTDLCTGVTNRMTVEQVIEQLNTALGPLLCLECPTAFLPTTGSIGASLTPTLVWNPVLNATAYDVYLDTVNPPINVVSSGLPDTSYIVTPPLLENTVYYWSIVPTSPSGQPASCSVQQFTTLTVSCEDPMTYMIRRALENVTTAPAVDAALQAFLNEGLVLNSCNLCCPDCGVYMFSNAETFGVFVSDFTPTEPCCINTEAGVAAFVTMSLALSNWRDVQPTTCCNDFSDCVITLSENVDNFSAIVTAGIIEYSTINNNTEVCNLVTALQAFAPALTPTELGVVIESLLGIGIVIACKPNGQMFIGSLTAYQLYITIP